jgi:dienelactone hydrolase
MNSRPRFLRAMTPFLLLLSMSGAAVVAQHPPAARVVAFTAADGTNLKGTYFGAGKPGPGVLLLHQCNRQRKVWDDLAAKMAASGLNVLTLDFRGFGESGGTPLEKLSMEEAYQYMNDIWYGDVDTAFRYLVSQPGVAHTAIGAGGASCGVNQAVQLARRHAEVKSLVLLSESTNSEGRQFLRGAQNFPVFMAVADDDEDLGVVDLMQWLYSLSSNPVSKFVRYPVGGHGVEMFAAHKELPDLIADWLVKTLRTTSSNTAVNSPPPMSRETQFFELLDQPGGVTKAAKVYEQSRQADPKTVLFPEVVVNRLGYEHLQAGDSKGGIGVLQLNVTAYPNSPNVYDSLSDAYFADGQKDLARTNAKKALELLATDTTDSEAVRKMIRESAEQKLKQLDEGPP